MPADDSVPFLIAQPEWIDLCPGFVVQKGGPRPVGSFVLRDSLEHGGAFLKTGLKNEEHLGFHSRKLQEPAAGGKRGSGSDLAAQEEIESLPVSHPPRIT
jgi:hypothetical protein